MHTSTFREHQRISEATEGKIARFSGLQHGFHVMYVHTSTFLLFNNAVSASEWNFVRTFNPLLSLLALLHFGTTADPTREA